MKITVIGSGYVGLVSAACLAEMGNDVLCLDTDARKIEMLRQGRMPIFEPGLQELIGRNAHAGRIRFTTDVDESVAHGLVQMIAVGTPSDEDGSADLQYVLAAARAIGQRMNEYRVIVDKSTVPVGTGARVRQAVQEELARRGAATPFSVASNPEFLKEGAALDDFNRPDRIVVGADDAQAMEIMREMYAPFLRNHDRLIVMDIPSAELTKYAANAMLATRISFMNELANLAERVGADIESVRKGIGSDQRIGFHFLYAGCGYGGSCFPKDVRALRHTGRDAGRPLKILEAVEQVNEAQKEVLAEKIVAHFGPDLSDRRFALWGLAFKPGTDDMREATSRVLIARLLRAGATIIAHDPVAVDEARQVLAADFADTPGLANAICFVDNPMDAVRAADALLIVTEWKMYRSPDFAELKALMKTPLIFDGRNLYEPESMEAAGIGYHGIGRHNRLALTESHCA